MLYNIFVKYSISNYGVSLFFLSIERNDSFDYLKRGNMKNKKVKLSLISCLLTTLLIAQTTFQKRIWGNVSLQNTSLIQDGNYLFLTSNTLGVKDSIVVSKTDLNGTIIWSANYNGTTSIGGGQLVLVGNDKYLIATENYQSPSSHISISKIQDSTNIAWCYQMSPNKVSSFEKAIPFGDTAIVIVGKILSASNDTDMFVGMINTTGKLIWAKSIGFTGNEVARSVVATSDGNIVVIGNTDMYDSNGDILIVKINSSGQTLWSKTYDFSLGNGLTNQIGYDIIENTNSQLLLCGKAITGKFSSTDQQWSPIVMELDASGTVIFSKSYTLNSGNGGAFAIKQKSSNEYIFIGEMGNSFALMNSIDNTGTTNWSYIYTKQFTTQSTAQGLSILNDGYILSGTILNTVKDSILLIKTNSLGFADANQAIPGGQGIAFSFTSTVNSRTISNIDVTTISTGTITHSSYSLFSNSGINSISLSTISVNVGSLNPALNSNDSIYTVLLHEGTTTIPTMSATTTNAGDTISYVYATTLSDTSKIIVTSQNSSTKRTYFIRYHIQSNDASLQSLTVSNGTMSPVFSSSTFTYNVNVPTGTITVPSLSALSNNSNATTAIVIASKVPGTTTITVTAEDGTKQVYTLNFYSGTFKEVSFILPQFVVFENQNINIGGCVNMYNNVSIHFKSSDTSIAKIDNQGILSGIKYGTSTVFAIDNSDSTQKDSTSILVLPNIIIVAVTVLESGTQLQVIVKNGCELYNGIENDFTVAIQAALKAESTIKVTQVLKNSNNPNELLLQLASPIPAGQSITVSYAPVNIQSDTASVRTSFTVVATATKIVQSNQVNAKLYPNPTQTAITIEAEGLQAVKIYSLQGDVVATATANGSALTLSIETLPAGMYIAELFTVNQNVKLSLIKR